MFIKITGSKTGNIVRININLIASYYSFKGGSRVNYTSEFGVDAVESPEQIDELIKKAMEVVK